MSYLAIGLTLLNNCWTYGITTWHNGKQFFYLIIWWGNSPTDIQPFYSHFL